MQLPNDNWTEFDWELALRESDRFAERYFQLLQRFCDLPGANELIARYMGPEFESEMLDFEHDMEGQGHGWGGDFADDLDWDADEDGGDDGDEGEEGDGNPLTNGPGEALFYETDPVFVALRQAAIGWCNIYAAILPQETRERGLQVLFHIGRCLANLAYSIDDGTYEQPTASIAFAKRALWHLNQAVGLINQLTSEHARLKRILVTIRNHMIRGSEGLVDHLQRCRERMSGEGGEEPDLE